MNKILEVVAATPGVRLAGPEDNAALIAFMREREMDGAALSLRYERAPDFFAWPKVQGDESWTFIFATKAQAIGAVGTLVRRGGQYYLGDLRFSRQMHREVYKSFWAFFAAMTRAMPVPYYTYVFAGNEAALRFLTRGREGVVYRPVGKLQTVFVFGRKPWRKRPGTAPAATVRAQGAERSMVLETAPRALRWLKATGPLWGNRALRLGEPVKNLYLSGVQNATIAGELHALYNAGVPRPYPFVLFDLPGDFDRAALAGDFWVGSLPTLVFQVENAAWAPGAVPRLTMADLTLDAFVS
jgi:hypothetical protein